MTTDRRGFLKRVAAWAGAVGVASTAKLSNIVWKSDPDVPPRVDILKGDDPTIPVIIRQHGQPINVGVVAYDLHADTAVVYRTDPSGVPLFADGDFSYETLRGVITVEWDKSQVRGRRS